MQIPQRESSTNTGKTFPLCDSLFDSMKDFAVYGVMKTQTVSSLFKMASHRSPIADIIIIIFST